MIFRKKRDIKEEVLPSKEDVEVLKEIYSVDLDEEILKKIEKLSFIAFVGAKDEGLREKALKLYGKVKLVRSLREDLIKLYIGSEVPKDLTIDLREKGLAEVTYKLSGVEIKGKNRDEILSKIDQYLKEEIELKGEVKKVLSGAPFRVDEGNADIAGKIYELGGFEIYLLPKGWFDMPKLNGIDVERCMKEIEELKDSLPQHVARFLES